ncbi:MULTISPECIES: motility associated factor glycosyltransferase family protein [unclassified Paenibacillus]|uniref:motility associated factor glycosyltransferase family protein n=1 Tax=unclassified Paenibacillus TaxID=185978 RepID=UPI00362891E0
MILIDNVAYLKKRQPNLWKFFKAVEDEVNTTDYAVSASKAGNPCLTITLDGKENYIHSKYNPVEEAERWMQKYEENMDSYEHIFFYGVGLGYHIETLMERYPDRSYSLYEPDVNVFYQLICSRKLDSFPTKNLKNFFVEFMEPFKTLAIEQMVSLMLKNVLIIVHPVYERLFAEQTKSFLQNFRNSLLKKYSIQSATKMYERLWTVNSLYNFTKVLETQNIFREKKHIFSGKPIVMVAAGPSLEDEIDNLKKIKNEGLAYIISIGSANRALIKNGIFPDAVTTYDPNTNNHLVFEEIIEDKLEIPMIFGTSVGYKTVQLYPGPMLYMITNQDPVSSYYLKLEPGEIVSDAPSIATVTVELMYKLGAELIVLVGQNFGYRNDQFYAKGIEYSYRESEQLSEAEKETLILVDGVEGEQVQSHYGHNLARHQMEHYIENMPGIRVINTTKGGAKIKGTEFQALEEVMHTHFLKKVVDAAWYEGTKTKYDTELMQKQINRMKAEYESFHGLFDRVVKLLRKLDTLNKFNELNQLAKLFPKLDDAFKRLTANDFFNVYVRPMVKAEHEILARQAQVVRENWDVQEKAMITLEAFSQYLYSVQEAFVSIEDMFLKLQTIISMTIEEMKENQSLVKKGE